MEEATISKLNKTFEESAYEQDGIEYWLTRELQELLDYTDLRNFLNAVTKAKESCEAIGEAVSDHFVNVTKTILIPLFQNFKGYSDRVLLSRSMSNNLIEKK